MKNERKAWLREDGVIAFFEQPEIDKQGFKWFPLYTHPVKEQDESFDRTASHMAGEYVSYPIKELTDEEIAEVFDNTFKVRDFEDAFLKFARAILRKAQE